MPVDSPWFTICSTAPSIDSAENAKMPSTISPMWLTDEYAIKRLMSVCIIATIAP